MDDSYTFEAAADLSGKRYHIMQITDGDKTVNVASLKTYSAMIGVLQNEPGAAGRGASVKSFGFGPIVCGAAVNSAGVYLTTNGAGRAIAAGSGDMVCARALETGGADGVAINAQYIPPFRLSGAI